MSVCKKEQRRALKLSHFNKTFSGLLAALLQFYTPHLSLCGELKHRIDADVNSGRQLSAEKQEKDKRVVHSLSNTRDTKLFMHKRWLTTGFIDINTIYEHNYVIILLYQ